MSNVGYGSTLSQPAIFAWRNTYFLAEGLREMAWAGVTNFESYLDYAPVARPRRRYRRPLRGYRGHRRSRRTTPEEGGRLVDGPAEQLKPRAAELGLEGQVPRHPFRRTPYEGERDSTDDEHLAPENLGRIHGDKGSGGYRTDLASPTYCSEGTGIAERKNQTACRAARDPFQSFSFEPALALIDPKQTYPGDSRSLSDI